MVDVKEISKEREFYNLIHTKANDKPPSISFIDYDFLKDTEKEMLNLQGHQIFIKNLFDPHTRYKRLLLNHSTGTGKTIGYLINSRNVY